MNTFYGQSFVCEMCELEKDMLPYSKKAFMSLFSGKFDLKSSPFWYEERTDFSQNQIGVVRIKHKEMRGIETLQGTGVVEGSLLGGCLDSMYEILCGTRYQDQVEVCSQYDLFPSNEDWKDKILFFESSEEKPDEMLYRKQLESLKEKGVFKNVKGIIVGKPQDEINYDLYKKLIIEVVDDENLPILYNFNFGHSLPRACFPYGIKTKINIDTRDIEFIEDVFEENN
jgi:muramoyltetrapeptide carboxypeptidase LdcA involved in peptidoglycan recycling